ncbi:hypothetical protein L1D59_16170 [Pseudoalteromonas piscicida]|nr:hypothetical protein [Pseudoalteromonas piscicida]MCG9770136.1 hypothetical protein [Pseudoalteromonas piscicida]
MNLLTNLLGSIHTGTFGQAIRFIFYDLVDVNRTSKTSESSIFTLS